MGVVAVMLAIHTRTAQIATICDMAADVADSDTVTFLEYVAEPAKAERKALGVWVILFLLMFTAFTWFLKQEYWKDVK